MPVNNLCMFTGRVSHELEVHYTTGGKAVLEFSLAQDRRVKRGDQWEKEANYINNLVLFGERADALAQHSGKGHELTVHCEAVTENWEDKATGQKRSKIKFYVLDFQFGRAPGGGEYGGGGEGRASRPGYGGSGGQRRPQGGGGNRPPQNQQRQQPRQQQRPMPQEPDDFGDGPITEGMDDEIPF